MEKKESKVKKSISPVSPNEEDDRNSDKVKGFPKDVDFQKFLGCGG